MAPTGTPLECDPKNESHFILIVVAGKFSPVRAQILSAPHTQTHICNRYKCAMTIIVKIEIYEQTHHARCGFAGGKIAVSFGLAPSARPKTPCKPICYYYT